MTQQAKTPYSLFAQRIARAHYGIASNVDLSDERPSQPLSYYKAQSLAAQIDKELLPVFGPTAGSAS